MNTQKTSLTVLLLVLFVSITFGQKQLLYQDKAYESTIKTIQLYPNDPSIEASLSPPIKDIDDDRKLLLEFDDLREDADYYFVYFIHCNADWQPSDLRAPMYMTGYNEFEIMNFEFSSQAKINYVHYSFELPKFKETGNYLAVVYRDRKKKDIILSKRFSLYKNQVAVGGNISRSSDVANRLKNQRVEVTLNYAGLNAMDPSKDFTVVVRQNQRPDVTKLGLDHTFIDDNAKLIRYQNLGEENDFPGWNEFRFFDISTVNGSGRNVAQIGFTNNRPRAQLIPDRVRDPAYFQVLDVNGQYYIRDLETGRDGRLTAEYVDVKFTLDYPETSESIYLVGQFNQWIRNESSLMRYDPVNKNYYSNQLLKQGWYNYLYTVDSSNPQSVEQSFFETENLYEVLVYFKPMGGRGDQLVGYSRINYNSRR
ncbi:type IX secretion system plug protein domain-containing protein [Roseivirga sp. E12]|uniref:type IX secretion system plug protein n=1 Tax=Roseivirga sp. E12 TaxID=2819237 RepID=UPI001ABC13C6|nr:type IX secretion system plug protein domain-containing protein [Roseivirga sp. E12]MBO3697646.1 DUF5103 domain-containing protein [Roseivirga sp. E12]